MLYDDLSAWVTQQGGSPSAFPAPPEVIRALGIQFTGAGTEYSLGSGAGPGPRGNLYGGITSGGGPGVPSPAAFHTFPTLSLLPTSPAPPAGLPLTTGRLGAAPALAALSTSASAKIKEVTISAWPSWAAR